MKLKITRSSGSKFFAYWRSTRRIRDLGDYIVWFAGWEFKLWTHKPYYDHLKEYEAVSK
jgi:hypothetical protein